MSTTGHVSRHIFPLQVIATSLVTAIVVQFRVFLLRLVGCKQIDSI
jgi:hypothetical protein